MSAHKYLQRAQFFVGAIDNNAVVAHDNLHLRKLHSPEKMSLCADILQSHARTMPIKSFATLEMTVLLHMAHLRSISILPNTAPR